MPEFESHTLPVLPRPDLASPTFKANPYPFYARLRAEAPVYRFTLRTLGKRDGWLVSRYANVLSVLKDPRLAKDPRSASGTAKEPWVPGFLKPLQRNMLDLDPPDHTRLRGLVHKAFTPRLVEQLRGRIQALCDPPGRSPAAGSHRPGPRLRPASTGDDHCRAAGRPPRRSSQVPRLVEPHRQR